MSKIARWSFTEETVSHNVFKELQVGKEIEGILAFLENKILRQIVTAQQLGD